MRLRRLPNILHFLSLVFLLGDTTAGMSDVEPTTDDDTPPGHELWASHEDVDEPSTDDGEQPGQEPLDEDAPGLACVESDPSTDDGDAPGIPCGQSDAKNDSSKQNKRRPGRPVVSFLPKNIKRRANRVAAPRASAAGVDQLSAQRKPGRPRSCQSLAALRRNKLNDERKEAERALQDVANHVPGAAAPFAAAIQTPGGHKAFPDLVKASAETKTARSVSSASVRL